MPYYRHLKEVDMADDLNSYVHYATMQAAREGINVKTETVTFIASATETHVWHGREEERLRDKTYLPVPWYVSCYEERRPVNTTYHYAHLSLKSPGLVAYTKNDEHGVNDRQTAVKPAKYLAEFYADKFTDSEIRDYVAKCSVTAQSFKLATSEADITSIFGRTDCGFSSCMQSKRDPDYSWDIAFQRGDRLHPCAVYGDSDLAVAYLGDLDGSITARCVVWPERKVINLRSDGTVYGDQTLKHILLAAGYKVDSIVGAKVRLLRGLNGGIIMPYVDNLDWANVFNNKFVILDDRRNGRTSLSCGSHESGYGDSSTDNVDRDNNDDDDRDGGYYTCEHCNERYDYGMTHNGDLGCNFCDDCIAGSYVCGQCDVRKWNDATDVNGDSWCEHCADEVTLCCANQVRTREGLTECGETWIEVNEFTSAERTIRTANHVDTLCRKCAEGKQSCVACAVLFDATEAKCDCGLTVRCDRTTDLLDERMSSVRAMRTLSEHFYAQTESSPF